MENDTIGPGTGDAVLVTGGYGLVGSSIVRRLVAGGADVTVVDAMLPETGANPVNLEDLQDRFTFIERDYVEIADWKSVLEGVDCIFHLAGQTGHMASMADPERDLRDNQLGFLRLLEAARAHCPDAHVLLASTRQIYGRPERLPVDERHPLRPPDINAVHQVAAENYLDVYAAAYGLRSTVLRLTNTYGPGMRIKDARQTFVGIWLRRLLDREPFEVWGRDILRDLTYVDDCTEAFFSAAGNPAAFGRTYNLGALEPVSLGALADLLVSFDPEASYIVRDIPEARRKIDIGDFYADISLIGDELGWQPRTSLETGLRACLDWYRPRLAQYLGEPT